MAGDWQEAMREARAGVTEAQAHLRAPTAEALERTWPGLERAAGALRRTLECWRARAQTRADAGAPEARGQLERLRREIARLRTLLEGAAALRLGWARRLYAATCGYTAQGEPALPQVARTLSVEG